MEDKNISKMDIEFYLLNREYADLSVDELKIVNEHVASEQAFNEMKAVLMGVGDFFKKEEELEPNPAIKTALLKEFNKQQPAGSYWLNGIFISLFPKEKKLFQKPGVQLIGLAASVLLVVTFTFNLNDEVNSTELAQNDEVILEQKVIDETQVSHKVKTIEPEQEEFVSESDDRSGNVLGNRNNADLQTQLAEEEIDANSRGDVSGAGLFAYDSDEVLPPSPEEDMDNGVMEEEYADRNKNEVPPGRYLAELKKSKKSEEESTVVVDKLILSGTTAPTAGSAETTTVSTIMDSEMEDAGIDLPMHSRTLSEDADLIGILYTAM